MSVVIRPVFSEKAVADMEEKKRYTFVVDKKANKIQIKNHIASLYDVDVVKISTMIAPHQSFSKHTRSGVISGKKSTYKKAIVVLAEGQEIDMYDSIS